MKINGFTISENNKKMNNIPSFSVSPLVTCAKNVPCKKNCYAYKMYRIYKNVGVSWENNYNLLLSDNGYHLFVKTISTYCLMFDIKHFRYNVGGDLFSVDYLDSIFKIARKCKTTKFLLYTKQFSIVNTYLTNHKMPKNLNIVLSFWNSYRCENIHNLPIAEYCETKQDVKNGFTCPGNCKSCYYCFNMSKGQKVNFIKH